MAKLRVADQVATKDLYRITLEVEVEAETDEDAEDTARMIALELELLFHGEVKSVYSSGAIRFVEPPGA